MEENLRIVYKNNEGVRVVIPAEGQDVEELIEKSVPNGAEYKVIKISEIPTDRDFRGAWEYMSGVKVNIEKAKEGIDKAVHHLDIEYSKLQLGRANPSLVEDVMVDQYGSFQPLKNMASVSCLDSQTLIIKPWDKTVM